jgi:hypothetical protein
MAGVLNFQLGLSAAGFIGPMGAARATLGGFLFSAGRVAAVLGTLTGLGAGFSGVIRAIGEGDRLGDLAAKLRENAGDLFKLEFAFDAVGQSAVSVGPTLIAINRALGGMDENGESTAKVFARLGLDLSALMKLDAPEKLKAIGAALKNLSREEAGNAASQIAGRGGADALLAIAGNADDFSEALAKAAPQAEIISRSAEQFGKIDKAFKQLRLSGSGFFLGIAEGAGPAIQQVLDKLNKADLTEFGQRIGEAVTAGTVAFNEGQLGELFEVGLKAAMFDAHTYMLDLIGQWGEKMRSSLADGDPKLSGFEKLSLRAIANAHELFGAAVLGIADEGSPLQAEAVKLYEDAANIWEKAGGKGLSDIFLAPGINNEGVNPWREQFKKMVAEFAGKAPALRTVKEDEEDKDKTKKSASRGVSSVREANSLEKIGAIFDFGRGGSGSRSVEVNTRQMVTGVQLTNQLLKQAVKALQTYKPQTDLTNQ